MLALCIQALVTQ